MDEEDRGFTGKPLLGKLIEQAVYWALVDCLPPPDDVTIYTDAAKWAAYQKQKEAWVRDPYSMPASSFDPGALAQNVACRLLGKGGWSVNGCYSGNGSAQQVFDATFPNATANPVLDFLDELEEATGLKGKPISDISDLEDSPDA